MLYGSGNCLYSSTALGKHTACAGGSVGTGVEDVSVLEASQNACCFIHEQKEAPIRFTFSLGGWAFSESGPDFNASS